MWQEIATWQETLKERPDLSAKTVALYTQDARRFATWVQHEHPGLKVTQITPTDAKAYRDSLLAKRYAPMRVHESRRSQPSRSPTCKSQLGVGCSSFDEAKDSSIARSRWSRKPANRS